MTARLGRRRRYPPSPWRRRHSDAEADESSDSNLLERKIIAGGGGQGRPQGEPGPARSVGRRSLIDPAGDITGRPTPLPSGDIPLRLSRVLRTLLLVAAPVVGLAEIAELLGVSRQRAVQIVRDHADFPEPVADLASGRVWHRPSVDAWMAAHPDRKPGRPRKDRP